MPDDTLTSPGGAPGGGPSDGSPDAGGGAEAQAVEGGGTGAALKGTPARSVETAQGEHDWEKRYVDTQRAYTERNVELRAAIAERDALKAEQERIRGIYGDLSEDNDADPDYPPPGYPPPPAPTQGYPQQEPPHIAVMRERINELYLTDPLQANQLAFQYGFLRAPNAANDAQRPQPGLTEAQAAEIADRRYAELREREDAAAKAFDTSLDQIRADVPGGFVDSVEAKLVAYAEEHGEHNAWNCLHATCEAEYRAAVKAQMLDAAWAEIRGTSPNALPPRPAALGGPDAQPAPPNALTKQLQDLGYSTEPPKENAR